MLSTKGFIREAALVALAIVFPLVSGCSDDSAPRNVVTVTSINLNDALSSDVLNNGADRTPGTSDDFVYEDRVTVQLLSVAHDGALETGSGTPYDYVFFERYTIEYEADEEIPTYSGALGWTVTSRIPFTGALTVVPAGLKSRAPLIGLVQGGEISAAAKITIYGHESTSNAPVKIEARLPVHFANWVDLN